MCIKVKVEFLTSNFVRVGYILEVIGSTGLDNASWRALCCPMDVWSFEVF